MTKPMKRMLQIVLPILAILGFIKYRSIASAIASHANFQPPPDAVTSAVAKKESWNTKVRVVGSLEAIQGAILGAEEKGKVVQIGFENGAAVKAGDLLVQLDVSVEQSQLKSAQAKAQLALVNFQRAKTLREKNANSQSDYDNAKAQLDQSEADAAAIQAMVDRKTIRAPFAGRAGIRMVNLGQFVDVGKPVVPLYTLDPIHVNFSIPQQQMNLIAVGQPVEFSVDAFPGEKFSGTLSAIDPSVQESNRNLRVQATVKNSDERLRPGMFAQVQVVLPATSEALVIPATSISYAPYGDSVYVITKDAPDKPTGVIEQRFVQLGAAEGDLISVTKGIKEGDEVVSSGLFKLRPGAHVLINNTITPGDSLNPTPEDK